MVFSSVGGKADHFMRYGSTQWSLPTPETYNELIEKYNLRTWEGFREYEDLRKEYEDLRPVHNLDKDHCNVWDNIKWRDGKNYHPCQKPTSVLERMINTSSNAGAVVLDPFMGSGSTGVACINTGRNFIGIEKNDHYFEVAKKRIEEHIKQTA